MFKINNRNTKTRCEICSNLIINTTERHLWYRFGISIFSFVTGKCRLRRQGNCQLIYLGCLHFGTKKYQYLARIIFNTSYFSFVISHLQHRSECKSFGFVIVPMTYYRNDPNKITLLIRIITVRSIRS